MRRFTPLAGVVIALAFFAGSHQLAVRAATNWPATCATLQTVLNAPTTLAGDTVSLTNAGVPCTEPTITYPVTLPNKQITLTGVVAGDGFNGQGAHQILRGSNVGATVITKLTFENGHVSGFGGAIFIDGTDNPTISHDIFTGNSSDGTGAVDLGGSGGTITIDSNTFGGTASGAGNTSTGLDPGAVWIDASTDIAITNNSFVDNTSAGGNNGDGGAGAVFAISRSTGANITFTGNTLTGNSETGAAGIGGGATLQGLNITVTSNTFNGNSIGSGSGRSPGNLGGGLVVVATGTNGVVTQSHNLFENNRIGGYDDTAADGEVYDGGGGEYVQAPTVASFDDTFVGNQVDAGLGSTTAAGGGLGLQGLSGTTKTTLTAVNLVATNNIAQTSEDGDADGGGIYAGFSAGCADTSCPAEIDLFDSTVTANTAVSGPGMSGGAIADVGHVTNSIVYGNTGNAAQLNFTSPVVTSSDSCSAASTAYAGTGNICADPALVSPAGNNVHETSASPTINKGNNALIPSGVTTDYAGNPRISGGTVDMGAAEFVAPVTVVVPPVPAAGALSAPAMSVGLGLVTAGTLMLVLLMVGAAPRLGRRRAVEAKEGDRLG